MWIVMMVGMMLPSAAPTILLVTSFHRRSGPRAQAPEGARLARFAAPVLVAAGIAVWIRG
jgi:predicted metal-binding membrane protein